MVIPESDEDDHYNVVHRMKRSKTLTSPLTPARQPKCKVADLLDLEGDTDSDWSGDDALEDAEDVQRILEIARRLVDARDRRLQPSRPKPAVLGFKAALTLPCISRDDPPAGYDHDYGVVLQELRLGKRTAPEGHDDDSDFHSDEFEDDLMDDFAFWQRAKGKRAAPKVTISTVGEGEAAVQQERHETAFMLPPAERPATQTAKRRSSSRSSSRVRADPEPIVSKTAELSPTASSSKRKLRSRSSESLADRSNSRDPSRGPTSSSSSSRTLVNRSSSSRAEKEGGWPPTEPIEIAMDGYSDEVDRPYETQLSNDAPGDLAVDQALENAMSSAPDIDMEENDMLNMIEEFIKDDNEL